MTTNWRDRAACRRTNPTVFFPEPPGGTDDAARVCAACPVRTECLAEALALRDIHGFRGGHTGEERARLLRVRAVPKDLPAADVATMLAAGWSCPAIAARLDVHVDSVRRVRRKLAKAREAAA